MRISEFCVRFVCQMVMAIIIGKKVNIYIHNKFKNRYSIEFYREIYPRKQNF